VLNVFFLKSYTDKGTDPDHSTDEQARSSPQAVEWAKARAKERAQQEKYGVFTKIPNVPEGAKVVQNG